MPSVDIGTWCTPNTVSRILLHPNELPAEKAAAVSEIEWIQPMAFLSHALGCVSVLAVFLPVSFSNAALSNQKKNHASVNALMKQTSVYRLIFERPPLPMSN